MTQRKEFKAARRTWEIDPETRITPSKFQYKREKVDLNPVEEEEKEEKEFIDCPRCNTLVKNWYGRYICENPDCLHELTEQETQAE